MAFLWKAIGLSGGVPNFPFTAVSEAPQRSVTMSSVEWLVQDGTADEDNNRPVSIFSCKLGKNATSGSAQNSHDMACNALKRAKSLVLPGFLRCYGGTEYDNTIYIALDRCEPLRHVLASSERRCCYYGDEDGAMFEEGVAFGLKTIADAVCALHSNSLVHGNVCCDTVYVTASGGWCLSGLELVSTVGDTASLYYRIASSVLPEYRQAPEAGMQSGHRSDATLVDSWGMACLIYESLGVSVSDAASGRLDALPRSFTAEELRTCGRQRLPKGMQSAYASLCAANVKVRHTVAVFRDSCSFITSSEYVHAMSELREMALKDVASRESFFTHLANILGTFPLRACMCTIVPAVVGSLQTGATYAAADVVTRIASRVKDENDFEVFVAPGIVSLFRSNDRALRHRLLITAESYAGKLSVKTLNEQVWPCFVTGFTSTTAGIREHSARALVHIAPRLAPGTLTKEVPRLLSGLQQDRDGAIRTNATICMCLIAPHLPAEARPRILLDVFPRMLKDPFAPSRTAALRAIQTTIDYMNASHLAAAVLPAVVQLTLDPVAENRTLAARIVKSAIENQIEAASKAMLAQEQEQHAQQQKNQQTSSQTGSGVAAPGASSPYCGSSSSFAPLDAQHAGGWPSSSSASSISTPAPAGAHKTLGAARHANPLSLSSSSSVQARGAAQTSTAAPAKCNTGWDDADGGWGEDDDKDGWSDDDEQPAAASAGGATRTMSSFGGGNNSNSLRGTHNTPQAAHVPSIVSLSTDGVVKPLNSGSVGRSSASDSPAPMKLRKKGGLGAARLD